MWRSRIDAIRIRRLPAGLPLAIRAVAGGALRFIQHLTLRELSRRKLAAGARFALRQDQHSSRKHRPRNQRQRTQQDLFSARLLTV
jgi:hypothetical protein